MSVAPSAQAQQTIGQALLEVAPPGWRELRVRYMRAGKTAEYHAVAVFANGTEDSLRGLSWDFRDAMWDLRDAMHTPTGGAWYTAHITITADLRMSWDFDYDHEPDWDTPVVAATYVQDLQMFPRAEATWPDWLRAKVTEGRR